jgi:hypothetical protein
MNLLMRYCSHYLLLFPLLFIGDNMNTINSALYYLHTGQVLYYYDSMKIIDNTVYINDTAIFSIIK